MSEQTDEQYDQEESQAEAPKRNFRRELEDRAVQAEQRAAELERKLAFGSVKGLDVSNPAHAFFAENYKGDLTPEAVSAKFTELGFNTHAPPVDADVSDNAQAHARIDAASYDAPPANISSSEEQRYAELNKGQYKSLEEFAAAAHKLGLAKNLLNG